MQILKLLDKLLTKKLGGQINEKNTECGIPRQPNKTSYLPPPHQPKISNHTRTKNWHIRPCEYTCYSSQVMKE